MYNPGKIISKKCWTLIKWIIINNKQRSLINKNNERKRNHKLGAKL